MSIVLLAILAVMWAAFLLPLVVVGQRGQPGRPWRRLGGTSDDGWRPARTPTGADREGPGQRDTPRRLARRGAVLRRRRILLALAIAVVAAVRAQYLLGGRWWIAEIATGSLLLAYLSALMVQGRRRHRPARAAASARPARRRQWPLRGRGRRQAELPLWSTPLLEGQAPSRPE